MSVLLALSSVPQNQIDELKEAMVRHGLEVEVRRIFLSGRVERKLDEADEERHANLNAGAFHPDSDDQFDGIDAVYQRELMRALGGGRIDSITAVILPLDEHDYQSVHMFCDVIAWGGGDPVRYRVQHNSDSGVDWLECQDLPERDFLQLLWS